MADNINYAMMTACERIGISGNCPAIDNGDLIDVCPEDCPGYRPPEYSSPKDIRETYNRRRMVTWGR